MSACYLFIAFLPNEPTNALFKMRYPPFEELFDMDGYILYQPQVNNNVNYLSCAPADNPFRIINSNHPSLKQTAMTSSTHISSSTLTVAIDLLDVYNKRKLHDIYGNIPKKNKTNQFTPNSNMTTASNYKRTYCGR